MTNRIRNLSRATTTLVTAVALSAVGGSALAYWSTTGQGTGQAAAGTLSMPTSVSVNAPNGSATTLTAAWTAPSSGVTPTGYRATAGAQSCTATHPATSCTLTGLSPSTGYSVVVSSLYKQAWTAPAPGSPGTTNPPAPSLVFSSPSATTGVPVNTTFGGTTNSSGTVTVTLYKAATATGTPAGTLTATPSGGSWTTGAATMDAGTEYTAVASQSTAGGTTTSQKTFTTAAASTTLPAPATVNAARSGNTLTASWTAVTGAASYECSYPSGASEGSWIPCTSPRSDNQVKANGTFSVRAIASDGTRGATGTKTFTA